MDLIGSVLNLNIYSAKVSFVNFTEANSNRLAKLQDVIIYLQIIGRTQSNFQQII